MKLKLKYDNVDDISEAHRELFAERDGAWHFDGVEGMKTQGDVDRVQKALQDERKLRKDAEDKAKKFSKLGDVDVDDLVRAKEENDDLRAQLEESQAGAGAKGDAAVQAKIDAAVRVATQKHERELKKLQDKLVETDGTVGTEKKRADDNLSRYHRTLIRNELLKVAAAQKVLDTAYDDVLMYTGSFEVEERDGDQDPVVRVADGKGFTAGIDPSNWLSDMKAKKGHWWPASAGGGAKGNNGKTSAGGPNPFAAATFNLQAAAAVMKTDPAQAQRLAKDAGFATPEEAAAAGGRAVGKTRKPGAAA